MALQAASLSVPAWAQAQPAPAIAVTGYLLQGNTLLTDAELAAVTIPHTGPQTLAGINAAAAAIESLYRARGFGTVVARVPEQTIADGTVRIEITEGRLGQVQVTGNRAFSRDNILRSLPGLRIGTTPDLLTLDSQAAVANENPAKKVRLIFQPGLVVGEVDAVVSVVEQPAASWTVGLDNSGRRSHGAWRASLSHRDAALFGLDHSAQLRIDTSLSRPQDSLVAAGDYRIPLYGRSAAIDLLGSYSLARDRGIATPAGDLSYSGQGTAVGVRLRHLVAAAGEIKQQLSAGLDLRRYRNACSIGAFGSAGCGPAAASVLVRPLTLGYQAEQPGRFAAGTQLSANAWPGGDQGRQADFDAVRPGADAHYLVLRAQAIGYLAAGDGVLSVRASAQLSPDALVPAEQFGLGGAQSVRGYQERELAGDRGGALSIEWSTDPLRWLDAAPAAPAAPPAPSAPRWRASVFLDAGTVRNQQATPCGSSGRTACTLAGAGIGVQWSRDAAWSVRVDAARALRSGSSTARGDHRLHLWFNHQI